MKLKLILLPAILILAFGAFSNARAQWVQTNGPYGGPVYCFAVNGTNLYAGTGNGVYLSTNNGTTWAAVNAGMTNFEVTALFSTGTNIVAGTFGRGVFRSTDNGVSWNAVDTIMKNKGISSFVLSGAKLFAGTSGGIYLSTDNGRT